MEMRLCVYARDREVKESLCDVIIVGQQSSSLYMRFCGETIGELPLLEFVIWDNNWNQIIESIVEIFINEHWESVCNIWSGCCAFTSRPVASNNVINIYFYSWRSQ